MNGTWKLRIADTGAAGRRHGVLRAARDPAPALLLLRRSGNADIIAAPPAVVTAESASPANGAPDPDETVTVKFPLQNLGTGATTNSWPRSSPAAACSHRALRRAMAS